MELTNVLNQIPSPYMVDNTGNTFHVAPDKGTLEKPVTTMDEQIELMMANNETIGSTVKRQAGSYWKGNVKHGSMPLAPSGYQMFRNIRDFGAVGDGIADDTAAINRAASWFSASNSKERCGASCGQTTTLGAVVYFPVSSPNIT